MFNRSVIVFVLLVSMSCLGQLVIIGGTATTGLQGAVPLSGVHGPLISTPNIALPGSGNAVGAPLSSAAANDSRTSSGPSVYNPNGPAFVDVANYSVAETQLTSRATPVSLGETSSSTPLFENGIQHFESGLSRSLSQPPSLAEVALVYRQRRNKSPRLFNNDSIAQMNARGVRTGNLGPEGSSLVHSSDPSIARGPLMAQNQPTALPQSDQEQSLAAPSSTGQSSPVSGQQRHPNPDQTESTPPTDSAVQSQTPKVEESKYQAGEGTATTKLPQTGYPLPLLLVLAGLGFAGALYWMKR